MRSASSRRPAVINPTRHSQLAPALLHDLPLTTVQHAQLDANGRVRLGHLYEAFQEAAPDGPG